MLPSESNARHIEKFADFKLRIAAHANRFVAWAGLFTRYRERPAVRGAGATQRDPGHAGIAMVESLRTYLPFQPASRPQAASARGLAFSHCVMERVSLEDILLFMQVQ